MEFSYNGQFGNELREKMTKIGLDSVGVTG
jgi:hypothetical protein